MNRYCEAWASVLCQHMSPLGVVVFLMVLGLILGHISYRILNSFRLGQFLIYLNWLLLPGILLIFLVFRFRAL